MSTVVLVNAYEYDYLGTRLLAAWLEHNHISAHCILLDDNVKILVQQPQERFIGYQAYNGALSEHKAMHQPLGPADWEALEEAIRSEAPRLLGFSARSTNNFLIEPIVRAFKNAAPDALLVAGGFGPTLEPGLYLEGGFDVVVRGDGEEALLELARCVEGGDVAGMRRIANTSWSPRHGGAVNPLRDQQKDLSRYPGPLSGDAHFTWIQDGALHRHEDPMLRSNVYRTFLGRGCPGKCTYCSGGHWKSLYHAEEKKAYVRRNRSIEEVIEECRNLPDSVKLISFCDEYWSLPKKETEKFFRLYKEKIHKPFWAYLAYEQMVNNPALMDLVIDCGLEWTGIGFQTGSKDLLQQCYDRREKYSLLLEYAWILFHNFVTFSAQFIGGNSYESWNDLEQTLDLIRKLPVSFEVPHSVTIANTRLRPHPESPIIGAWPRVVTDPMPADEWYFRALLMQYCRFFSKEEFSAVIAPFADTPPTAAKERNRALEETLSRLLREKQAVHYKKLMRETSGAPWICYGAGDCYVKNREFFAELKPRAILVDRNYLPATPRMDGVPVFAAEDWLAHEDTGDARFMVFLKNPQQVKRKLLRSYGKPFENIHSCSLVFRPGEGE